MKQLQLNAWIVVENHDALLSIRQPTMVGTILTVGHRRCQSAAKGARLDWQLHDMKEKASKGMIN
jgi:hypothetical protein